jgi:acetolactate synthase-1/2/3 large subunit
MADGYARATGKPGVVLVTSGPGATNAITGIATAHMDSIPLVVISGQVPTHLIGDDAFQETDMVGISRPVVKHSYLVKRTQDLPKVFKQAFHLATTGRPGPVVIDVPKDITDPQVKINYSYPQSVSMRSYNPVERGHSRQIKKAIITLLKAKRPVIYVGGGVIQGNASEPLRKLVQQLGYPLTNTLMGLGAYPGTDRQCLGMLGMHGTYEANMAMHHSDLILALGARFDDRVTNKVSQFCPQATIIHVDIDPTSISKTVAAHIPIVGPLTQVLEEMLALLAHSERQPDQQALAHWWQQINQWRQQQCLAYDSSDREFIKPQQVIETLYQVTQGDAIITSDVGQHQMFAALYYPYKQPRQWINSGGLGTMGFGLPAAMGAQLAYPDKQVACVTGDGSIQMNIQELSTCIQYGLPVKIINLNNSALGMVKQWQDMQYQGRHSHSYMDSLPDFVKLAESYGHVGIKVTSKQRLQAAMADCFNQQDRLVFMDIQVDPEEHVYPMHITGGAMKDMHLARKQ